MVSQILIRWIVIYPVDSAIQRLNNRGQFVTLTHAQHECSQHSFGFPSRPFQFFAPVSNPVAFLFKTLMKPLLYMSPDPPKRASLCSGVKASCLPVQNLNETPWYIWPRIRLRGQVFGQVSKPFALLFKTLMKPPVIYAPGFP